MSIKQMTSVWENSRASEGALLVLLSIADHASDEGLAYPSVARLAQRARMTPRGVQYALEKLTGYGELEIDLKGGPRGVNLYRITVHGENIAPEARFTTNTKLGSPGTIIEPSNIETPLSTSPQKPGNGKTIFRKPTPEEVDELVATKYPAYVGKISGDAFVAHYEAVGWKVGQNKMTNWKAAVYTWIARRERED